MKKKITSTGDGVQALGLNYGSPMDYHVAGNRYMAVYNRNIQLEERITVLEDALKKILNLESLTTLFNAETGNIAEEYANEYLEIIWVIARRALK